jgi:tripartite-type tricarboxylate transporter receptor subunit TctC
MKSSAKSIAVLLGFLLISVAQEVLAQTNFYEGKTIRFIVGFSAGGGYDTYTRLIARHLGKHVPGNPVFVVDNMAGAGSLISANYIYKVAKPDGLTIGHFIGGLFLQQLLGKPGIEFDSLKFEYSVCRRKTISSSGSPNPPVSPNRKNESHPSRSSSLAAWRLVPEPMIFRTF